MQTNIYLKGLRINRGISANELAKGLGYSRGYISLIESGKMKPTVELLSKYVLFFNLKSNDINLPEEVLLVVKQNENPVQREYTSGEDKLLESKVPGELTKKMVNLNFRVPADIKVLYSDIVSLSTSEFGVVLDFGQRMGSTDEVTIVSRIGLSPKHGKALMKLLEDKLKNIND